MALTKLESGEKEDEDGDCDGAVRHDVDSVGVEDLSDECYQGTV